MRCLLVADLHYSLPQLDWVAQAAPRYDVTILAGDVLDLASMVDFEAQILVAQRYVRKIAGSTRLILSSGNHDLDAPGPDGEKIAAWFDDLREDGVVLDGGSMVEGDTLFTVCPWWDGPATRERIEAQIAADAPRRPARWIWVHHAPPKESPVSWTGKTSLGDPELAAWIERYSPDFVLSGHVHQSPFVRDGSWADRIGSTWVFNAGHQYGAPPAHVVIDTEVGQALWISAMGLQAVALDQPLQRPITPLPRMPDWFMATLEAGPTPA